MLKAKISICVVFILLLSLNLKAQENSPYSRFALGNLYPGYPIDLAGYGGLTAASEAPTLLNYANPASYGSLLLTTLSTGLYAKDIILSGGGTSQSFQNGSFNNLCFGFPVIQGHWGASFGLVPYSRQEYSIANLNNVSLGYNSYNSFDDSGSLYKFYIGNGFQIRLDTFNRINIGFNVSYLFGTLAQSDDLAFVDTFNAYNTQHMVTKTLGGVVVDEGFQYMHGFRNGARITFGVQGNLQSNVPGRINDVWNRFVFQPVGANGNGIKDTIVNIDNQRGNTTIPASFDLGVVYTDPTRFTLGADYQKTYWSEFSSFGTAADTPASLVNSWRLGVGAQVLTNVKKAKTDYDAMVIRYSAGFYYEQTYLQFEDHPIEQYAFTFGVGIPLTHVRRRSKFSGQQFSTLNFALELGARGTLKNSLLLEDYGTLSVGFTFSDRWFQKRKFD